MRMTGRIGLGLVIIAAVSWGGWKLWSSTRKWVLANVPLALEKGSRTQTDEFKVNVSGPYEIAIEAERAPDTSLNDLACSIGAGPVWPAKGCSIPSVLKVSWSVTSGHKLVASGSSDETHGGATSTDYAMRSIGYFQGQRGMKYRLSVDSLSDSTGLAAAKPRLKVSVGGTIYEFDLVIGSLLTLGSAAVALTGGLLLLASLVFGRKPGTRGQFGKGLH